MACGKKDDGVFKTVPNDPLKVKMYTLENGLKVYLTENRDEPRIYSQVAVRTGAKNDPAQFTGLAHYLEHMLFKGTSNMGTINWEAEKVELDKISALYEDHAKATTKEAKAAIYRQIDSISQIAAGYVVANEFDKLVQQIGASGTNAYTWVEETVYINDFPSNELERWAMIESERMSELVLRLFHTELEAVYEEFNLSQASDFSKLNKKAWALLFPTHPYGQQTTIGEAEHLKNPSMVAIHDYFKNYYVPNNMAVILSGDFDSKEALAIIEKHFGSLVQSDINRREMPTEEPLTEIQRAEVFGPQQEFLNILYRMGNANSPDANLGELASEVLSNGMAGIFDLNLLQNQKVLSAYAYSYALEDYGVFTLGGSPKDGQTLEQLEELIIAEIENLKAGNFDNDLVAAVIKNNKLKMQEALLDNRSRASVINDAFVRNVTWADAVANMQKFEKLTKEDLVKWANETFKDNYVVVYKRQGVDPNIIEVEKPQITPIALDRDRGPSEFGKKVEATPSSRITPVFVDFEKELKSQKLNNQVDVYYTKNDKNKLFDFSLILETGSQSNQKLSLAAKYLQYLGTENISAEDLKKKMYGLGLSVNVFPTNETTYISLSGLDESFEEALKLMQDMLRNPVADDNALRELINDEKKNRANAKLNPRAIRSGLTNYAMYGPKSPFTNRLSNQELDAITSEELIELIKEMLNLEHLIAYYGPHKQQVVMDKLKKNHSIPEVLSPLPGKKDFEELPIDNSKVFYAHYDKVPVDLSMIALGPKFNAEFYPYLSLFQEYFGFGLSSIVFQEIREAKALAYSAGAYISIPQTNDKSHYVNAFISTNGDKVEDAVTAFVALMDDMPTAQGQFEGSRLATLKSIETQRITGSSIFWNWYGLQKRGIYHDIRKDVYAGVEKMSIEELKAFVTDMAANKTFNYVVVGKRDLLDFNYLTSLGEFKELNLEEIFGY